MGAGRANAGYAHVTTTSQPPLVSMATALSSPLSDPGGRLICQRLALAVVLVDLGNTCKEIIRCFSITARFAGTHRSLQPNTARLPVQSVPVTIRQRQVRTRISYMTSEQLERFLRAAKEYGRREHAMFLFAVAHGARAQEICNLRISDINFHNEQIHIARLKGSLPSTQTLLKVKGNSLFDEKAALKAWLAVREADADNFVFNSQKSTQMNRVTIFKLFREIARKAGLGETLQHPHVLKHTAAMLLVQQGANAFLIRQALGHKSFDSTLAYVNPSDADASAALSKAFNQAL